MQGNRQRAKKLPMGFYCGQKETVSCQLGKGHIFKKSWGLGLKQTALVNKAAMTKICWQVKAKIDKPWVKVLNHLYVADSGNDTNLVLKNSQGLVNLKCLRNGLETLNSGIGKVINDGRTTKLWMDPWFPKGPLRNLVYGPLNKGEDLMKVEEIFGSNGT
ncbi:hypothetical protein ACH5RR_025578 [Cinchona calisaya]|uniref:Uncharacterized protein n=1 Tax=Cinchona calisaya TaxID=153742 RepID=A0ABD2Z1Y9_9GENT